MKTIALPHNMASKQPGDHAPALGGGGGYYDIKCRNTILLQLFKDFFIYYKDNKEAKKLKVFQYDGMEDVGEILGRILDQNDIIHNDDVENFVPVIEDSRLVVYNGSKKYTLVHPNTLSPPDTKIFMDFIVAVDRCLGTTLHEQHSRTDMNLRSGGTRRGGKPTKKNKRKGIVRDHGASLEREFKKPKVNNAFSKQVWPKRVLPSSVEHIFRNNFYPLREVAATPPLENVVPEEQNDRPLFKEYCHPPSQRQIRLDKPQNREDWLPVYVSATGLRAGCRVIVLAIGQLVRQKQLGGETMDATIMDFHTGTICISRPPWYINNWASETNATTANHKLHLVQRDHENDEEVLTAIPSANCCIVRRDEPATLEILRMVHSEYNEEKKRRARAHASRDSLSRSFLEQSFIHDVDKRCKFQIEDYENGQLDPYYRYLDDIPVSHDPNPTDTDWENCDLGDFIKDDQIKCNVCGKQFLWKSEKQRRALSCYLTGNYRTYFNQFEKQNNTSMLKDASERLREHCAASEEHSEGAASEEHGELLHHFVLKLFPVARCWTWELKAVNLAQELLWESFIMVGGIPRKMCEIAVKQHKPAFLQFRLMKIIGNAKGLCLTYKDKVRKRCKGYGLVVPYCWDGIPDKLKKLKELRKVNNLGITRLLEVNTFAILDRVYESFTRLPLEIFLQSFPSPPDLNLEESQYRRIGFGWNSLCLFFAAGLMDGVYFPFIPDFHSEEKTFQELVEDLWSTKIAEEQLKERKLQQKAQKKSKDVSKTEEECYDYDEGGEIFEPDSTIEFAQDIGLDLGQRVDL